MFDGKQFGLEIVELTKSFLERQLAPLADRLAALEKRLDDLPLGLASQKDIATLGACCNQLQAMVTALPGADAVKEMVADAVAAIPAPKDGERGTDGKDGRDGEKGDPGEKGLDGKDGASGVGLAGVLKDHEGCLVFTLSDGVLIRLGRVDGEKGKDGADGKDGKDADPEAIQTAIQAEVQKRVTAPLATAYKGVWKPGTYKQGDLVTLGGSMFFCGADTEEKPETSEDWKLAVKRGRDGKDGEAPRPPATVKLK